MAVSLFILTNCNDVTGSEEIKTPSEMILGKWKVSEATIDGSVYPVTNPGFGQIEVTFTENDVEYIYRELMIVVLLLLVQILDCQLAIGK